MSAKIDPQKAFLKEFKALPDLNFLPKRLFANKVKYIFGSNNIFYCLFINSFPSLNVKSPKGCSRYN